MKRQVVIGSLVGIALGAVLTASIAHGFFADDERSTPAEGRQDAADGPDDEPTLSDRDAQTFEGQPPLRPGSLRIGPPVAHVPTAEVPVALDAPALPTTPTV